MPKKIVKSVNASFKVVTSVAYDKNKHQIKITKVELTFRNGSLVKKGDSYPVPIELENVIGKRLAN